MRGYLITEKKVTNPEVSEKQMQEQTLEKNDPSNCHSANLTHFPLGTNYEHKKPLKQMKDRRLTSSFICPSQRVVLPTELKSVNQNQRYNKRDVAEPTYGAFKKILKDCITTIHK